jgi:hypothetical protein
MSRTLFAELNSPPLVIATTLATITDPPIPHAFAVVLGQIALVDGRRSTAAFPRVCANAS